MSTLQFECRHRYPSGFELDMSFEINHRFTSLFGPSGSGKTSVLSIIAGTLRPQTASVRIGDTTVVDTKDNIFLPLRQRNIGFVFQDALLFPHLTVDRNLRYGQRRRNGRRHVDFSRVVDVLELGNLLRRYPQNLSGGERQRVALGRALLSSPELLMMDEPLASLDDPLKDRVLTYLERTTSEWGIPTLFVTHNQAEVRRAADWVIVVERGRVIGTGTPSEALTLPGPLTWSNSTGPVNLLRIEELTTHADHILTRIAGGQHLLLPIRKDVPLSPSFIQFRPSDVILSTEDVSGLSVRNHLRGRICHVLNVEQAIFVAVDVGQVLWAEITPSAAAELGVAVGKEIVCLLKAHSLTLVG
jgi:molybdate transport system ATP-binding protein